MQRDSDGLSLQGYARGLCSVRSFVERYVFPARSPPLPEDALVTAIVDLSQCVLSRQSAPAAVRERALLGVGCSGRLPSEGRGHRFESCRARQINQSLSLRPVSASGEGVSMG